MSKRKKVVPPPAASMKVEAKQFGSAEGCAETFRRAVFVAISLTIFILIPYLQTVWFDFVNFDDPAYVYENRLVKDGLSLNDAYNAVFGFHQANWHPLVWLSYMAEIELFGMKPGVMHFTNVVLHIANSVLLYFWLRRSTGEAVRSFLAALIFAIHPMHVESVAWITERKDVLSTLFLISTLVAYTEYVKKKSWGWYLAAFVLFGLGLSAKGMLVTVPLLFLLLDVWPLQRLQWPQSVTFDPALVRTVLLEKAPFYGLSGIASVITIFAQRSGGAVSDLTVLPITARLTNAVVAYSRYCLKTVYPFQLSVFYPMPVGGSPASIVLICLLFLSAMSVAACFHRRRRPAFLVGWLWFLVSLLPVIGLIQVGIQSIADRYMYVPMIGLSIAILWCLPDALMKQARFRLLALAVPFVIMTIATYRQVSVWKNSVVLFEHSMAVEPVNNEIALHNLSLAYNKAGEYEKTIDFLRPAVIAHKNDAVLWVHLGNALRGLNQIDLAIECFRNAVQINPDLSEALNNLGMLICRTDNVGGKPYIIRAIAADPANAQAHNSLGNALVRAGDLNEAEKSYLEAIKLGDLEESKQNLVYVRELIEQSRRQK